jgi:thiol-disulfide isomerase/thioredoxin
MFRLLLCVLFLVYTPYVHAQHISGTFTAIPNQEIRLEGINGFTNQTLATATTGPGGTFTLSYLPKDRGVAYLISSDKKPYFVILSGEDIELSGEAPGKRESINILKGRENQWFVQYSIESPLREQTLSAWSYLEKQYASAPERFPASALRDIRNEIKRIKDEDADFLKQMPSDSYVKWFLPVRKLVSSVSNLAQYRQDEIPSAVAGFRALDYTDPRLYKSGLYKEAVEGHFWLIENSGQSLDTVYQWMCISIDSLVADLRHDNQKLNEVTDHLFTLLEQHSLLRASEYLALKVLNETSCTLNNDLAKQLESYRAMKPGNTAPDIEFIGDLMAPGYPPDAFPETLSDITSPFTLLVFGAGWCPQCKEDLPAMASLYPKWKSNGVEVVFISLDEKKEDFFQFAANLPFLSACDYLKWESPVAKDYFIFGTPTMYLIDRERHILLQPSSVKQMDAWVDWFLVQEKLSK